MKATSITLTENKTKDALETIIQVPHVSFR